MLGATYDLCMSITNTISIEGCRNYLSTQDVGAMSAPEYAVQLMLHDEIN